MESLIVKHTYIKYNLLHIGVCVLIIICKVRLAIASCEITAETYNNVTWMQNNASSKIYCLLH